VTNPNKTLDPLEIDRRRAGGRKLPGLVLIFSGDAPAHATWAVPPGGLELGRSTPGIPVEDKLISRQHVRVSYDPGDRSWRVEDLGSRNGTFVDGVPVAGEVRGDLRILRAGASVFLLVEDVAVYHASPVERAGPHIVGARLRIAWNAIRAAAERSTLHVTGETGSGKELAARAFHRAGPRPNGPFVAVNCAAIPEGVAERLLFGTRRGAFSGATADAEGYVQAADGGTLFLDEIGELDLAIQAKLLRVLEMREVLPLGAVRPLPVDIRLVSATHHDLRRLVAEKSFRQDLYYRIGRPLVEIPPLRERLDEIPHLVMQAVHAVTPATPIHVSLVETCLLRPWPGNVREVLAEVAEAARHVTTDVGAQVTSMHLAERAGLGFTTSSRLSLRAAELPAVRPRPVAGAPAPLPSRDAILTALRTSGGRVATAARVLGLRRNQLRRWLTTHQVDPGTYGADDTTAG
jgi:DNA-binding NtrC family response regulator